ncbi:acetoacetate--CoA ligase [Sphingobacterium sp. WQ 366]|uniref:Acetoacetate--CoA ligase n=2 Tax=Sphingobacterium bovistauri TaxID=2781959 RepID=A0ABS7Z5D4_9SPHI|nr:acetoacetate--CoA ligase [Sphingobacterium bovistauri]
MSTPLWIPSREYTETSNIFKFKNYIEQRTNTKFSNYEDFHNWSINNLEDFWQSILDFFKVSYLGNYSKVLDWNTAENFIGAKWFEGIELSYAEHIFKSYKENGIAVKFQSEYEDYQEVTWKELQDRVSKIQQYLVDKGIQSGDRIVGVLNNRVETIAIFLAVNSLGAIWSCCSPDFGDKAIVERFEQIEPKLLFIETEYQYNDKKFSKNETLAMLVSKLITLEEVVNLNNSMWNTILDRYDPKVLEFVHVAFSHPIWILYSSGTTGKPKAITHSTGGNLLEHYKALAIHQNVQAEENFLWYSTTGWMMWNYALSSLLCGATLCLFDGIINHNNHQTFWKFLKRAQVHHLGAGAVYFTSIEHLEIKDFQPKVIGSTGSPLPISTFEALQQKFPDVHLISLSGGTDVCSAFLIGNSLLPVYAGQLQCKALGADIVTYNEQGEEVINEVGELIIKKPMPSMPIYFWNDWNNEKYKESYFEKFPNVWAHGDWIKIISGEGIIIYGRSDSTLNRAGVRIGTAEIYSAVNELEEVQDSLVITTDENDGSSKMLLFVKLLDELHLNEEIQSKIKTNLRKQYSPRHVPDAIFQVRDIPYTLSGKKLEIPVKKIFSDVSLEKAVSKDIMRNPECLEEYVTLNNSLLD